MKKYKINICLIYVILWLLYFLQGNLYSSKILGTAIMSIFILWSLYFFVYVNVKYKLPPFLRGVNLLVVLFTIYGSIRIISSEVIYRADGTLQSSVLFLKNSYISLLPTYGLFYFYKAKYLTQRWIQNWTILFVIYALLRFYFLSKGAFLGSNDYTNNAGYIFVSLFAIVPLLNRKIYQFLLIICIAFFVLVSLKRGAIICYVVCLVYYIIVSISAIRGSSKKIGAIFIFSLLAYVIYYLYVEVLSSNDYLVTRILSVLDGDSGGRGEIYGVLWNKFKTNQSISQILFGMGADGTIKVVGNFAHNDWLEILTNHGILGIICLLFFYVNFVIGIKQVQNPKYRLVLALCFIQMFLTSIYSMSINDFQIFQLAAVIICVCSVSQSTDRPYTIQNHS